MIHFSDTPLSSNLLHIYPIRILRSPLHAVTHSSPLVRVLGAFALLECLRCGPGPCAAASSSDAGPGPCAADALHGSASGAVTEARRPEPPRAPLGPNRPDGQPPTPQVRPCPALLLLALVRLRLLNRVFFFTKYHIALLKPNQ